MAKIPTTMLEPIYDKIVVQTRRKRDIPNQQATVVQSMWQAECDWFVTTYKKSSLGAPRTAPHFTYNCHGLTFASRRTAIDESEAIAMILEDDGYEEVPRMRISPGDVIVYYNDRNAAVHSGIVIRVPDLGTGGAPEPPIILSKWGRAQEWIHRADHGPYDKEFPNAKYYRVTK